MRSSFDVFADGTLKETIICMFQTNSNHTSTKCKLLQVIIMFPLCLIVVLLVSYIILWIISILILLFESRWESALKVVINLWKLFPANVDTVHITITCPKHAGLGSRLVLCARAAWCSMSACIVYVLMVLWVALIYFLLKCIFRTNASSICL